MVPKSIECKTCVRKFCLSNFNAVFASFTSFLSETSDYLSRREIIKILHDFLQDPFNQEILKSHLNSLDSIKFVLNNLNDEKIGIQWEACIFFELYIRQENFVTDSKVLKVLKKNKTGLLTVFLSIRKAKERMVHQEENEEETALLERCIQYAKKLWAKSQFYIMKYKLTQKKTSRKMLSK